MFSFANSVYASALSVKGGVGSNSVLPQWFIRQVIENAKETGCTMNVLSANKIQSFCEQTQNMIKKNIFFKYTGLIRHFNTPDKNVSFFLKFVVGSYISV